MFRAFLHLPLLATAWDPFNLAVSPPMGFANWNGFGCDYNDTIFREIADALVATGMHDAGYKTMIIQECITKAGHRDAATGAPQPDPVKFPNGIADLVSYIHSKGLKAGIYTDVGPKTCAGFEGSYGHEEIDALTYAQWGIDFIEEDNCHHNRNETANVTDRELYMRMHNAILNAHNKTQHPMLLYMCVWGAEDVYQWGPDVGGLWRTTFDICPPGKASWQGMMRNFWGDTLFPNATRVGAWQDPDMLVVGMDGLSELEWRTHFSLWAMAAAPLWAGIDIRNVTQDALEVLTNKEVIAVDQDALGIMATKSASKEGELWQKKLQTQVGETAAVAVLLFNDLASSSAMITCDFESVGLEPGLQVLARDLWAHQQVEVGLKEPGLTYNVPPHGGVMLRLSQQATKLAFV